ncbi:MAG: T9SS type A sorting domain-containing protein, partial [Candidatus Cloacimonetes bacterium]|nr:T9SS type A sorting domain-containing protein [Candidatus Cloacimonadota bacterium]
CTNSSPVLTNVIISGNSGYEGGGLFCEGYEEGSCNPILDNVAITGNEAGYLGGGIYCGFTNVNIIIVNSLITGNIAGGGGGGIGCFYESNMSLTNVTISENISSDGFGGGIYTEFECNIHLENCIMWNDIPNEVIIMTGSFVSANYCDIEGGVMGTGNIDDDPLFSDDEFHLSEYSPCIDAGNPDSLYYDIEDPYNPGYALYPAMGTIINDMGAYGGHGYYEPPVSIDNYELHPATAGYELYNYPNPFNPETTIYFETTNLHELAQIEIYNVKGQKVETLECNIRDVAKTTPQLSQRGRRSFHSITWNAKNHASGIYLYRIKANDFVSETKKMLLIK